MDVAKVGVAVLQVLDTVATNVSRVGYILLLVLLYWCSQNSMMLQSMCVFFATNVLWICILLRKLMLQTYLDLHLTKKTYAINVIWICVIERIFCYKYSAILHYMEIFFATTSF